jgi:hypothetical protein
VCLFLGKRSPGAPEAIHDFLRFQIEDHHTGFMNRRCAIKNSGFATGMKALLPIRGNDTIHKHEKLWERSSGLFGGVSNDVSLNVGGPGKDSNLHLHDEKKGPSNRPPCSVTPPAPSFGGYYASLGSSANAPDLIR